MEFWYCRWDHVVRKLLGNHGNHQPSKMGQNCDFGGVHNLGTIPYPYCIWSVKFDQQPTVKTNIPSQHSKLMTMLVQKPPSHVGATAQLASPYCHDFRIASSGIIQALKYPLQLLIPMSIAAKQMSETTGKVTTRNPL